VTGCRLELRGVGATRGRARVLDGVDLAVQPGGWTAIVGPNGAGKSTLLRAVAGLGSHDGSVLLDAQDAGRMRPRERAQQIGYAPQVPLIPESMPVRDYVMLGRTPYRSLLAAPRSADELVVAGALERLDLNRMADRPLRTLSGGERQRAVLARVLAQQPRLLLLDEPTAALDLGHAQQVLELVDRLRREDGITVLSTMHDLVLAGQYADRVVLLSNARVAASGTPQDVLTAEALALHYGVRAEVDAGPAGVRVHPVRP
jgi:iron complex transport system ATP-binding protein